MTDLTVVTWLWGAKYGPEYVLRLIAGIRRNLKTPHRFFLMTERERQIDWLPNDVERHAIKSPELCDVKGCLARLQLFDLGWQANRGLTGKILNLDLDCIVTGSLDELVVRDDDFAILSDVNAVNPCPFNGSVMLLKAGKHGDVWTDFSWQKIEALPYHEFPDDQGWLWHKIPDAGRITPEDGFYAFQKPGWPTTTRQVAGSSVTSSDTLPDNAKLVAFIGWRDPARFVHLPWVREHWCDGC